MKHFSFCLPIVILIFMLFAGCGSFSSMNVPTPGAPNVTLARVMQRPAIGIIYTHTTKPLDVNMNQTPVGILESKSDVKHVSINAYLQFMWDSNTIYDIAKEGGIDTVYYADLETFSVLGIWNQYTVHIYGK